MSDEWNPPVGDTTANAPRAGDRTVNAPRGGAPTAGAVGRVQAGGRRPGGETPPTDEEMLRRVLAAYAERIEPRPDALPEIRRRIRGGAGSTRRRLVPLAGRWYGWSPVAAGLVTVAVLAVAAVAVGLAGGPPAPSEVGPPAAGALSSPAVSPSDSAGPRVGPAPAPSVVAPTRPGGTGAPDRRADLAVYYLGGPVGRPRLYREFHRLWLRDESAADRITAAVRNMLDGPTGMDPDYRSPWPVGTELRGVSVSRGIATVDLGGATRHDIDEVGARLAVQQLVWTVTAVPGVSGVRLRLDGAPAGRLWDRVEASGVLRRAPAAEVLAPVWLVSPQHGDTVSGTFEVHVAGILPEATARLRITQGGRTVRDQVVTLSVAGPAQGERRLTVTLPPGRYTLTAYAISPADGGERHLDDHLVTVR